jgi:hypothetical protein
VTEPSITPCGSHIVVRGHPWLRSDRRFSGNRDRPLVDDFMAAHRNVGWVLRPEGAALLQLPNDICADWSAGKLIAL